MARSRKKELVEGPWLSVAALCEKVIEDKTGKLSLINIVDRLIVSITDPQAPDPLPPFPLQITLVVSLKSGFVKGKYDLGIQVVSPSGKPGEFISIPALLEGDDRGVNVITRISANLAEEGLYWFEIQFEKRTLTKIPLRLVYQRVSSGRGTSSS